MATSESFSTLLKVYTPYEMLVERLAKRNYLWGKVDKDRNWMGGTLDVPFEGGEASSLSFGSLTDSSDVAEGTPVLGTISTQPELWGTMKFYEKDLDRHGDLKSSFLQLVPGKVSQFIDRMSERVSANLMRGYLAKVTDATNAASGIFIVDHPEIFTIGEKVGLKDDDTAVANFYVTAINMNTKAITLATARGGSTRTGLTDYSVAQNAKLYTVGGSAYGFTSLRDSLLSLANGGSTTLYGQTKTAYPFLQSQNIDGSSITKDNILDSLYDAFFDVRTLGKGNPTEMLVSMKHFKNCAKQLEVNRDYSAGDKKGGYGFQSLSLIGNQGDMIITGLRDMADEEIFVMDWGGLKFHGNNFFERKRHFNNEEFFLERATTGYSYITDIKFFGDLVLNQPSHCGVVYGINY